LSLAVADGIMLLVNICWGLQTSCGRVFEFLIELL
jgi:hypothetical protein